MITSNYIDLHRGQWSAETLSKYRRILEALPDVRDWSLGQLHDWINAHKWGSSQRYLASVAIRGYCSWVFGVDHPGSRLKIKRHAAGPQRAMNLSKLGKLMASFDTTTKKGIRDLAIASLLVDTGLRASEICRLELDHLQIEERRLSVITKGGNWEDAIYSDHTAQNLINWVTIRKSQSKTVFCSLGGLTPRKSLTRYGLTVIMRRWGITAEIGPLSPHDFRRTFAVISTRLGAPARVLQVAGRWSDIKMVERYTASIEQADFAPYFPMRAVMES